jgi:hypothetical protein
MNSAIPSPANGRRAANLAATTTVQMPFSSQRSICPVSAIPMVSRSSSTPEIQFISRGYL